MTIRTRIEPIERDVLLALAPELTPAGQAQALAAFAREQLAEADAQNARALGRVAPHERFVDGREGAPIDSVRPSGRIVFEFELLDELLAWITEHLLRHSPVLTARYATSDVLYADGVEVPIETTAPPADEYVFLNPQPYARKIERGLSPQAPDGVFEAVAALASRRFGNMARIRFSYRVPFSVSFAGLAGAARRDAEKDARRPAIVVRPR